MGTQDDHEDQQHDSRLREDGDVALRTPPKRKGFLTHRINAQALEATVAFDPVTNLPLVTGKITFREPSEKERSGGLESVDNLLRLANEALAGQEFSAWILFDRLDVAFADSGELEANALRALFKVYQDLLGFDHIRLKIFIRTDIWDRITASAGFREASHITKNAHITWNKSSLMNLVVRRLITNPVIRLHYKVQADQVLKSAVEQEKFFYRVFPDKVEVGTNKPTTFGWILGRTRDGKQVNAPRELIHLLTVARNKQLERLEVGQDQPPGETLIDRAAIKDALPEVSTTRLTQTLYAEYPNLMTYLRKLERKKTAQTEATLMEIWGVPAEECKRVAEQLVDIGFFERKGDVFWVPFLYRFGLNMIQGAEDTEESEADPAAAPGTSPG